MMEERFTSPAVLSRRISTIPRKPVGGHQAPIIPGPYMPQQRRSSEGLIAVEYTPYRSPIEEPSATFQYVPYRSPTEDAPGRAYPPNRTPSDALSAPYWNRAYRRPSAAVSAFSRQLTGSSARRGSRSTSNEAVSPISPISSPSNFRRPSVQSVDDFITSISREVSQYQANGPVNTRTTLSPLMEMSAQEAAFCTSSISLASPVGSVFQSRVATLRSPIPAKRCPIGPRGYGGEEPACTWLPIALRWPFILFVFMISIGLAGVVLALIIQSQKHHGLGLVQGPSIFLFGWRFAPTVIAVLYTYFTLAIVRDVKRTEPYARLSSADGACAASSLFLKRRSFWFDPFNALKRRSNGGFRNWASFWASLVNILSLFIIVPFSSAMLSPREIGFAAGTTFSKLSPITGIPLELTADDDVLFRTISSILLNTTTSGWVNDDYTVLPFWPSNENAVLDGAVLSPSNQEWVACTTVYRADLECNPMTLQRFDNFTITKRLPSTDDITMYSIITLDSFTLQSSDGCSLGFAGYPSDRSLDSIFTLGGGWWSTSPNFTYPSLWDAGNGTVDDVDLSHPVLVNASSECGDRSMFFLASPYKEGEQFQAQGQICKSSYYSAELPVTVSNNGSSSSLKFDETLFNISKASIDSSTLDNPAFEEVFMSQDWSSKFQSPNSSSDPTFSARPKLGGPLDLLGAQNGFDVAEMINNPHLADQARQLKQRFFGESMQRAFGKIGSQKPALVSGQVAVSEQRIVTSLPVGIVLIAALLVSSLMIGLVMGYTRLNERPLNLLQDPSSTKAIAAMISSGQNTRSLFEGLDTSSEVSMMKQLSRHTFYLRHGIIYSFDERDSFQHSSLGSQTEANLTYKEVNSRDWRPQIFRGWVLALLLISLASILLTLGILYSAFCDTGISQTPLGSSPTLDNDDSTLIALAPYSIIPTLMAVGVKLWWDSIDSTFRRLQPFVSIAHGPTPKSKGIKLSYDNSSSLWAAGYALSNRHFLLALITTCAVLSEIFIISMSALWVRRPGTSSHTSILESHMEIRNVPAIFTIPSSLAANTSNSNVQGVLTNVYTNSLTSWLYGATAEGAHNSTPLQWTSRDWALVPVDLLPVQNKSGENGSTRTDNIAEKVTVTTPSLRGRLECTPFDMSDVSSWLTILDFTDQSSWNNATIPSDLSVGYELKIGLSMNQSLGDGQFKYWGDNNPYFSFFAKDYRMDCCGNETDGSPHQAAIGYWSPAADAEHTSIVVKWITGYPFNNTFTDVHNQSHWVWKDIPKVTALNCTPIFETANAKVDVDVATGEVSDLKGVDTQVVDPNAWSHNYQETGPSTNLTQPVHNVSVSYGYLFHDILLSAADLARVGNTSNTPNLTENLQDRTFNFRSPGLNLDFMSYTSLALVQNENSALLDPNTLANVSSTVFSTFFKRFVQTSVTTNEGTYINGSWGMQPYETTTSNCSNTSSGVEALISTPAIKLVFNPVAVYLSLSILGLLIATTIFVDVYRKKYLKVLPRDVDTLGSILGFVYGSERLLRSAAYTDTPSGPKSNEMVDMGWFTGGGKRRWGIEIVDEQDTLVTELPVTANVSGLEESAVRSFETQRTRHTRDRSGMTGEDFDVVDHTMIDQTPPVALAGLPLRTFHIYR